MLNIPDELKQDYLSDSVPKQLYINTDIDDPTKLDGINWYIGSKYNDTASDSWDPPSSSDNYYEINVVKTTEADWHQLSNFLTPEDLYNDYLRDSEYLYFSFMLKFTSITTAPTELGVYVSGDSGLQQNWYVRTLDNWDKENWVRLFCCIRNPGSLTRFGVLFLRIVGQCDFSAKLYALQVESSNTYYEDLSWEQRHPDDGVFPLLGASIINDPSGYDFEELIHVHQPDILRITNTDLETESFSMTESLTSADNLKFGACEASYVDFSIVGRTENWKDRYIRPYITTRDEAVNVSDINWYKGGGSWIPGQTQSYTYYNSYYSWNMSTTEHQLAQNLNYASFQSIGRYYGKIVMGVKIKIKFTLFDTSFIPYKMRIYLKVLYDRDKEREWAAWTETFEFLVSDITEDFVDYYCYLAFEPISTAIVFTDMYEISKIQYYFMDENNQRYTSAAGTFSYTVEIKDIQLCLCDEIYWTDFKEYDVADCIEYNGMSVDEYIIAQTGNIPLGRYKVTDIQEDYTHEFRRLSITAYDDLVKLDQNAADWYTLYMYLVSPNSNSAMIKAGGAYVRQIFSAFWNVASWVGLVNREMYEETLVSELAYDAYTIDWNFQVYDPTSGTAGSSWLLTYGYYDVTVSSYSNKVFCVDTSIMVETRSTFYRYAQCNDYKTHVDSAYRGLINAQVCIEEHYEDGSYGHRMCVDAGDYFKLTDDCTFMRIYLPGGFLARGAQQSTSNLINMLDYDGVKVYNVDWEFDLENAAARMSYYNISTLELFACDSSITARDAARSILEMTGCFLALDRDGKVEFKYVTKSALFPRDDLYPSNNLYPKGNSAAMLDMSKYTYARCKPYKVQSIGRIQIVKQIRDNKAKSVCEWEYIGDPTSKQAYLIDDNIFYCNDAMEYDYGNMPDVAEILEKLYNRISNISYTPNETQCVGLPWVETGDMVGVLTTNGGFESFVFRRTLKGIMALKDEYEAEGDEYVKPVNNYTYKAYLH